ncbi:hypothetical protein T440DRAFT_502704 [Plenodomus tracheiphilus IPT5]|uniref:MYND-type domain-containing protein n=1 Tax=Plenodomus tracheiphilus IPT5 TaxID=1408161 RepID=A0A6A7AP86_9PLEO|nr:hypothetical protein T440DRAFT_502704 [Plenodomus tracheiphilus IPT5]
MASTPATALEPRDACYLCGKPASKCSGCISSEFSRSYCSKQCQKQDWPSHKSFCKDHQLEEVLKKAATVASIAYLRFRKNTWDIPIVKVDVEEGVLTIHREYDSMDNYFVPFPKRLMASEDKKETRRNMNQVLCAFVCEEGLAWMHNTLAGLLQGLKIQIEEINVSMYNIPRKTITVHPNGFQHSNWPGYSHDLLRITSKATGTQWAIDISGGQYGITAVFWPWKQFNLLHVKDVEKIYPFGTHKQQKALEGKVWGSSVLVCGVVGEVAADMDSVVKDWETDHKTKLSDLVRLPERQYLDMVAKLTDHMSHANRIFIKNLKITAKVRAIRLTWET